jgi:hypothetical protein
MTDFKDTLAKVTSTLNFQEKGKFPSQPQQNPKKQYNANASSSGSQHMDQVKSVIITLHSGVRLLKNPFLNLVRKMMNQSLRVRKGLNLNIAKKRSPPVLLFPHAMTKQREVNHDSEIYKTFKQEEIEDEKGTENVVVDHLSRLPIDSISDITPIDDYFPDESLLSLSSMPWFAKNINFLDSNFCQLTGITKDKGKFLNEVNFYWDDPYLFKYYPDQIFQRCISDNEVSSVIKLYHSEACGVISRQERQLPKSYKVDFTSPPCSRTHMLQNL